MVPRMALRMAPQVIKTMAQFHSIGFSASLKGGAASAAAAKKAENQAKYKVLVLTEVDSLTRDFFAFDARNDNCPIRLEGQNFASGLDSEWAGAGSHNCSFWLSDSQSGESA